ARAGVRLRPEFSPDLARDFDELHDCRNDSRGAESDRFFHLPQHTSARFCRARHRPQSHAALRRALYRLRGHGGEPPSAAIPPPLPSIPSLPPDASIALILDTLLKRPVQLIHELCETKNARFWLLLALVAVPAFALYGLVIDSFFGGAQFGVAALKISAGALV